MRAVVEVTGGHVVVLSGRMTREEFDVVLAAIDEYNRGEDAPRPCVGLAEGVRQDLIGFLGLVREWAPRGIGERLAVVFDEQFHISAPL